MAIGRGINTREAWTSTIRRESHIRQQQYPAIGIAAKVYFIILTDANPEVSLDDDGSGRSGLD